jgi:hypothetical protein
VVPTIDVRDLPPPPTTELAYGPAFSFVVELPDGLHLVLSSDIDPRWVAGEATTLDADHVAVPLHEARLPEALRSRTGDAVTLYSQRGALGTGRVGAPRLVASSYGDLSVTLPDAEYDAYLEAWSRDQQPPLPPSLVWDEGRRLLVAPIETAVTPSAGALWARDAGAPAPMLLVPDDLGDVGPVRAHLMAHPNVASLAAEMTDYASDPSDPSTPDERVETRRWLDLQGRIRASTAWFDGPDFAPCGGLTGRSWAMTTVDGDDATPVPFADDGHGYGPTAVFDLDGDGWLDVLMTSDYVSGDTTLLAGGPTGWRDVATMPEIPFHGCPC